MQRAMAVAKDTELQAIERRKAETQAKIDESRSRHASPPDMSMTAAEKKAKLARQAQHTRERERVRKLEMESKVEQSSANRDFSQLFTVFAVLHDSCFLSLLNTTSTCVEGSK